MAICDRCGTTMFFPKMIIDSNNNVKKFLCKECYVLMTSKDKIHTDTNGEIVPKIILKNNKSSPEMEEKIDKNITLIDNEKYISNEIDNKKKNAYVVPGVDEADFIKEKIKKELLVRPTRNKCPQCGGILYNTKLDGIHDYCPTCERQWRITSKIPTMGLSRDNFSMKMNGDFIEVSFYAFPYKKHEIEVEISEESLFIFGLHRNNPIGFYKFEYNVDPETAKVNFINEWVTTKVKHKK